jgi:hypothetical protein|tara:strand:- start:2847 stop:3065 length:219 start_codon:yes stop_codon:yes gene_type:complete
MSKFKFNTGDIVRFRPYMHLNSCGPWSGTGIIVKKCQLEPWTGWAWLVENTDGSQRMIHEADYEIERAPENT